MRFLKTYLAGVFSIILLTAVLFAGFASYRWVQWVNANLVQAHEHVLALEKTSYLGERSAAYLFSDTDVRDKSGAVLRRVDMLDVILHNAVATAQQKSK